MRIHAESLGTRNHCDPAEAVPWLSCSDILISVLDLRKNRAPDDRITMLLMTALTEAVTISHVHLHNQIYVPVRFMMIKEEYSTSNMGVSTRLRVHIAEALGNQVAIAGRTSFHPETPTPT